MKEIIIEDKRTIDLAVDEALQRLDADRDQVTVEVLVPGGLFTKPKVKVSLRKIIGAKARDFVDGVVARMKIPAEVTSTETADGALVIVSGADMGGVIGRHGEVLDALQYLASVVENLDVEKEEFARITVDSANYRIKRNEILENLALRTADRVITTGKRVELEPMAPHERRVIHLALEANPEVSAISEGEEPYRRLIIIPTNETPRQGGTNYNNNYNNGNRNNGNRNNGNRNNNRNQNIGIRNVTPQSSPRVLNQPSTTGESFKNFISGNKNKKKKKRRDRTQGYANQGFSEYNYHKMREPHGFSEYDFGPKEPHGFSEYDFGPKKPHGFSEYDFTKKPDRGFSEYSEPDAYEKQRQFIEKQIKKSGKNYSNKPKYNK